MEAKESLNPFSERVLTVDQALDVLLNGGSLDMAVINDSAEIDKFNAARLDHLIMSPTESGDIEAYHQFRADLWFIPKEYQNVDVLDFLMERCSTEEERDRVAHEYSLFDEHNLVVLLRFFIYMVAHFRENGIMWGVGRGSSVASYILYLIGVHRIDSIKYNLDLTEFFK